MIKIKIKMSIYTAGSAMNIKAAFSLLDGANELGIIEYIETIKDGKKLADYVFTIFFRICEQSYKITGNHYTILLYFYELIDMLKIKYNKTSFINAIHICLDHVETYMQENMHSQKSNYYLLRDVLIGIGQ